MNMKKRVLLINGGVYLPGEGGYKRTMYLFDMMKEMDYTVTLLTSDFNHYAKKKRDVNKFYKDYPNYSDIKIVHMPSYKKNISLKRYFSGKIFSRNVKKWVEKHIYDFDVIMISMPAISTINGIYPICEKNGVKMLIDVRDLRPEAFKVIIKNDCLYNILFSLMKKSANKAYSHADEMIAVSEEYLKRGLSCNTKAKSPKTVYIGSALEKFDEGVKKFSDSIIKHTDDFWVTYAGTLGSSYDLDTLLDCAKRIQNTHPTIKFKILGQGPEEGRLKELVKIEKIHNVEFLGFMPYEKMAAFLAKSDLTINSIKKKASQSIINKVADYFAAGIPMVNGCPCKEQQEMVDKYHVGLNYESENVESLTSAIISLATDEKIRKEYGLNARRLAMEKFNRSTSYLEILRTIDNM